MIRRLRPPGISPLEVWDVVTPAGPLYAAATARARADGIVSMLRALVAGSAVRARGGVVAVSVNGDDDGPVAFDRVVVGGGGDIASVVAAIVAAGFVADAAGVYVGTDGGCVLCAGAKDALIVDVGQTSIKRWYRGERSRTARPPTIPMEQLTREPQARALARAHTVRFIATALQTAQPPSRIVLALPCEIDDDLVVQGCSYPWHDDDCALVNDVARAAGIDDSVDVGVINDAELAACTVVDDGVTLMLTVGLGVGAALVRRPAPG